MAEKNKVEVFIGGKSYKLAGEESESYMQKVAKYIDQKMMDISGKERSTVLSTTMVSILTAINVADDYFKAKEQIELLSKQIEELQKSKQDLSSHKDDKIEMYEQLINELQNENIELKNKLDEVIIELNNAKNELIEYIEAFDKKS